MTAIAVWWRGKCALRFTAEETEVNRESDALILSAQGNIEAQDAEAVERLLLGNVPCRWEVTRGGETLLDDTYATTIFTLEPEQLVASLSAASS